MNFRSTAALIVILAQLVLAWNQSVSVICVGSDKHFAIEAANHHHCYEEGEAHSNELASGFEGGHGLLFIEHEQVECEDISLTSAAVPGTRFVTNVSSFLLSPRAVYYNWHSGLNATSGIISSGQDYVHLSDLAAFQRATVLLI